MFKWDFCCLSPLFVFSKNHFMKGHLFPFTAKWRLGMTDHWTNYTIQYKIAPISLLHKTTKLCRQHLPDVLYIAHPGTWSLEVRFSSLKLLIEIFPFWWCQTNNLTLSISAYSSYLISMINARRWILPLSSYFLYHGTQGPSPLL